MENVGIYKIINPNGNIYIGQSIDLNRRIGSYKKMSNCNAQLKLYNSFLKYGVINHIFEIIENCSIDELNNRERYWQEFYKSVENGLNCLYVKTDTKKKILSNEVRKKMSISGKGKTQSKEHIEKRILSKKGYIHTFETKQKLSEKKKKILIDIETGVFYDSIDDACKIYNIKNAYLSHMLTGRNKNKTNLIYA
jgi:group I intron endonuclease